ncbi:Putative outer membrane lipoprotein [Rubellimicrobium mesophilum DSM 19309]|uniref:Putative outer membrane lipoprotein n=1 Tax=Rubellimicrobium mesophilum DSM 19309 TaxID=442562 RepID=A0A017HK33_9RHOB|nr:YjbH domain-containing protein [Rubellimicrobium mesophilum]EYD74685.1 Putative outer membrane lipoprotein [Rubellimicrobium mesophilum DSM 19309]
MAHALRLGTASALALLLAAPVAAQDRAVTYTLYGTPGLLEMPTALSADDGEIAGTLGYFGGQLRNSFTFQVTPRLSGTFRYSGIQEFLSGGDDLWDRSFDLRFRFNDEGIYTPMVAVGLQDFLGTGIYSGEYVVATKTIGDAVRVTAGLGWGRLGTHNGFTNPLGILGDRFETRPTTFDPREDEGGTPGVDAFFRGDAAVFGGVEWAPNERWILKAEYSSDDAYVDARDQPLFDYNSPLNFGVTWRPMPGVQLGLGYLYGSQLSFTGTVTVNPNEPIFWSGLDPAPQPVAVRADAVHAAQSWDRAALPEATVRDRLALALRTEGVELNALELTDRTARLRYTNTRYRTEAQAMGRVARILTQELPPSIEQLTLEPQQAGIPLSSVTFARTDIEAFENEVGGSAATLAQARFDDAAGRGGLVDVPPARDRFSWGIRPYLALQVFDPENPLEISLGAEVSAAYRIQPNLIFSGSIRQRFVRTGDSEDDQFNPGTDDLPAVRTNAGLYAQNDHPVLQDLTLAYYGRPGRNLYSRVTVGYLETMYGGLSTEVLWAPVASRLAVGAEVNYAKQRDFDQLLEFRDYDVVTGHLSAYYDFGNGFHGEIDAGRYLAGDWGATFALDREFENGWRVGGYFTLTDVPFDDFGEGSFDKGIRVAIPVDFIFGQPTRREITSTLRSLNRDGGARLDVEGRLYDIVREGHYADLEDSWGRFWR